MSAATLSQASDAQLVAYYRDEGRDSALAELVRRHQITVFRLLVGFAPTPDHAEADCEKVFVLASRRISELEEGEDFRSWALSIAREVAFKKESRPKTVTLPRAAPVNEQPPQDVVRDAVQSALTSLHPDERLALVMADVQGEPVDVMAATLGITQAQVEERVEEAREKFLNQMEGSERQHTLPSTDLEVESSDGKPFSALPAGTVVDKRYRVKTLLGKGGMGAVYRAEHVRLHRDVALKTLHGRLGENATVRERFVREAEVLGKLEHENFVAVSDFGETDHGLMYLVMELIEGKSLGEILGRMPRLNPRRALDITRHILTGLEHAHERGIVHRDVKPDNIVLLESDENRDFAKILDLGIAASDGSTLDTEDGVYGTPAYMAPEHVLGREVDGRADLYAVSILLFQMLTGRLPFDDGDMTTVLALQLSMPPPTLSDVASDLDLPKEVQALLNKGLDKNRSRRFQTAREFIEQIDAVRPLVAEGYPEVGPGTPVDREARTLQSVDNVALAVGARASAPTFPRWAIVLLVLVVAALIGATVWRVSVP